MPTQQRARRHQPMQHHDRRGCPTPATPSTTSYHRRPRPHGRVTTPFRLGTLSGAEGRQGYRREELSPRGGNCCRQRTRYRWLAVHGVHAPGASARVLTGRCDDLVAG
jgi:hypothetical protein